MPGHGLGDDAECGAQLQMFGTVQRGGRVDERAVAGQQAVSVISGAERASGMLGKWPLGALA